MTRSGRRSSRKWLVLLQVGALSLSSLGCSLLPPSAAVANQTAQDIRAAHELEARRATEASTAVNAYHAAIQSLNARLVARLAASVPPERGVLDRATHLTSDLVAAVETFRSRPSSTVPLGDLFHSLRQIRDAAEPTPEEMTDTAFMATWLPIVQEEQKLWDDTIGPLLREGYEGELWRRLDLLDRKYFGVDGEKSNILEAALNGWLGPTQSIELDDSSANVWPRLMGVSRLEAIARIEPVVTLSHGSLKGAVGAIGLTQHFFPEFTAAPGSGAGWRVSEDFWSRYVKRVGIQLGAGVIDQNEDDPDAALGVGFQVSSFSIWCLRDFERDAWLIAVGLSDFRALESILPVL